MKKMNTLDEFDIKIIEARICPYCGERPEFVDSIVIYGKSYGNIYFCKSCDAYVGVHKGTEKSLGRLANKELREAKKEAHYYFDQLWNRKLRKWMKKKENHSRKEISSMRRIVRNQAYSWLSKQMNLPAKHTHIGMFSVERCQQVIELCKPYCKK